MDYESAIEKTVEFVKDTLKSAEGGHDWWHILRVWNLSKQIAKNENANMLVVELGALLHDIADSKFYNGDEEIGPEKASHFLESINVEKNIIEQVEMIIRNISFKNNLDKEEIRSPELDVVRDADRLDAMGAIGIARTFNFGGYKNREMYNPDIKPNMEMDSIEYKKKNGPTINHFYEKLLLLKDLMNTKTGKKMAEERHKYMEDFLEEFYKEWNGEK